MSVQIVCHHFKSAFERVCQNGKLSTIFDVEKYVQKILLKVLSLGLAALLLTAALAGGATAARPSAGRASTKDTAKQDPKCVEYWLEKDSSLEKTNPRDKSSKYLLHASTLEPSPRFYPNLVLVRKLTTNCQDLTARKFIDRVRLRFPGGAEAYVLEGTIAQEKVQPEIAKACFMKALEARKYYGPEPLNDGALGLQAIGCSNEAIKLLERTLKLDPSAQDHFAWGICMLDLGRYKEAQQHLRLVPEIKTGAGYALKYLMEADCKAKDWFGAIEDSKNIDKIQTVNAFMRKIRERRGDAFAALGKYREAVVEYSKAIKLWDDPIYYQKRAECYKLLGQSDLAAKDRKKLEQLTDY